MNGLQIETFAMRFCREKFQGVFSCDTLPPKPTLLVCNTDPHDKPGTHWIEIYVDKNGRGEYFLERGTELYPATVLRGPGHCTKWTESLY